MSMPVFEKTCATTQKRWRLAKNVRATIWYLWFQNLELHRI